MEDTQKKLDQWQPDPASGMEARRTIKEHQFEVSSELSYIQYREPDVDMTEKGPFVGIAGRYDFRPEGGPIGFSCGGPF